MLTIENALILLYVKDKAPYIAKAGKRKEEYNKKMIAYNKKSVCCAEAPLTCRVKLVVLNLMIKCNFVVCIF